MLKILNAPHPVLAAKAKKIKKIDKDIQRLIADMTDTLLHTHDPEGVGLAAPQIGESLQLFIVKEDKDAPLLVFINPEIKLIGKLNEKPERRKDKKHKDIQLEGCLSLYSIWGIVHRYPEVEITYMNEKGETKTEHFNGFLATILQHEYDHLQGMLFPKRVLEQKEKLYKSVKDEHGETVFEEIAL